MLNFKKGLAIVLAAATALTFAPVSNFGAASVVANAAATATGKETTGGVLKTVPLYNGETIDLIENASISYNPGDTGKNAVNYYKSSLTWYLTNDSDYEVGDTLTGVRAKKAPANFQVKPADGSITAGKGVLSFKVTDANAFASDYPSDGLNVVAAYPVNGKDMTVVYKDTVKVASIVQTASDSSTKVVAANDINISFSASQTIPIDAYKGLFDSANAVDTDDLNKYVDLSKNGNSIEIVNATTNFETGANFKITLATGSATDGRAVFKQSTVTQNNNLTNGTYYETGYVAYKVNGRNTINIAKINLVASVSTGPKVRVKDNGLILASSYDAYEIAKDPTVYLNLKTNKTYDIAAHLESDIAGTTYTYKSNYSNITVDAKGVVTAKTAGPAEVEITPKAGDVSGITITLYFQVNANPFAAFTVSGKDSDTSDVLDGKVYDNNVTSLKQEYNLAAAQVKYIQIEDNGNETSDIKEPLKVSTTATGAAIHFVFAATNSNTVDGMVINDRTGEITVPYGQKQLDIVAGHAYAVKVDVAATANTEATTGYFYFVVDYSDSTPAGLEDAYTVGTDQGADKEFSKKTDEDAWQEVAINFGNEVSGATVINYVGLNNTNDALKGTDLYKDSKIGDFATTIKNDDGKTTEIAITSQAATKATVDDAKTNAGSVAYVLVDFQKHVDSTKNYRHQGHTYRIVKLTGAEGKTNLVTSIVNADTNETVYDSAKDSLYAPKLAINGVTHLTVTLAYPVDKNNTKFNIYSYDGDNGVVVNQPFYVTAVKSNKVSIALYPNSAGTQVIYIEPSGNISKTDRTITRDNKASFAVTYSGALVKPSKVTGLKVKNKKGAKVSVSFSKVKTYPTMLYYVQKKVGKKTSGKTVGSTKTSLSVAKGKTVKVRVKAYYFDENGTKHVGKYSSWKTLKTDKK